MTSPKDKLLNNMKAINIDYEKKMNQCRWQVNAVGDICPICCGLTFGHPKEMGKCKVLETLYSEE